MLYERKRKKPDSEEFENIKEEDHILSPINIDGVLTPQFIDYLRAGIQTSRINYESVEYNKSLPIRSSPNRRTSRRSNR